MTPPIASDQKQVFGWVDFSLLFLSRLGLFFICLCITSHRCFSSPPIVVHLEGSIQHIAEEHARIATQNALVSENFKLLRLKSTESRQTGFIEKISTVIREKIQRTLTRNHLPIEYEDAYKFFDANWGWSAGSYADFLSLQDRLLTQNEWNNLFWNTSLTWIYDNASSLHATLLESELISTMQKSITVLHAIPNRGLAHVSIGSLGLHHFGFAGFNESGLSISTHSFPTHDTTSRGTSSPVIASEVLRNARSIEEAIIIIRGFPRISGTVYVLTQGRKRVHVETNAYEISVKEKEDSFSFQTDIPETPSFLSAEPPKALLKRQEELEKTVQTTSNFTMGSPQKLMGLLDQLSTAATIFSVVMDPHQKRILMNAQNGSSYEITFSDLRSTEKPKIRNIATFAKNLSPSQKLHSQYLLSRKNLSSAEIVESLKKAAQQLERNQTDQALFQAYLWGCLVFDPKQELMETNLKLFTKELPVAIKQKQGAWLGLLFDQYKQRPLALRYYAYTLKNGSADSSPIALLGLKKPVFLSRLTQDWVHLGLKLKSQFVTEGLNQILISSQK